MNREKIIQNLKNKYQILSDKIQHSSPDEMVKLFHQQKKTFDALLAAQTHKKLYKNADKIKKEKENEKKNLDKKVENIVSDLNKVIGKEMWG